MLAGTDAGEGGEGSWGGVGGDSAVRPHSMGGVRGGRGFGSVRRDGTVIAWSV